MLTPETRFWDKVDKSGGQEACWPWTRAKVSKKPGCNYGTVQFNGRQQLAHRVAWQLTRGPIPDGAHVLHHCDNPPCVNPAHLFLGTDADNAHDRMSKGRPTGGTSVGKKNGGRCVAKLTEADVLEIRSRLESGEVGVRIAREFGLDDSTITLIKKRRRWVWPT
jgi:hypothetical protein